MSVPLKWTTASNIEGTNILLLFRKNRSLRSAVTDSILKKFEDIE